MPDSSVFPDNISWQHIGVVNDMMDEKFCNNKFPYAWRSSLAIYANEPEVPEGFCGKITYLKISATITGYQPTESEIQAGYNEVVTFPNLPTEEDIEHLFDEYFGCYGALLNVSVHPNSERSWALKDFPKIHDFEPKIRELKQTATESGSILTKSSGNVSTNHSLTSTNSSESKFSGKSTGSISLPITESLNASIENEKSASFTSTNSLQDVASLSTTNTAERQETQGITTNLSQLYNLMTGFHGGTNRATFLMLARPHVLQATTQRTFIQGLQEISGQQDFFLVVVRPTEMEGLCIDARLDTGHFPEDVEIKMPEPKYRETYFDFVVNKTAKQGNPRGAQTVSLNTSYTLPSGWVIDKRTPHKGDTGHIGIEESYIAGGGATSYNYQSSNDTTVVVNGIIKGRDFWRGNGNFHRRFRVYARSEEKVITNEQPKADIESMIITSRKLCTCFVSKEPCLELRKLAQLPTSGSFPYPNLSSSRIIDERNIRVSQELIDENFNGGYFERGVLKLLEGVKTSLTISSMKDIDENKLAYTETDHYYSKIVGLLEDDIYIDEIKSLKGFKSTKLFNDSCKNLLKTVNKKSNLINKEEKKKLIELRKSILNELKTKSIKCK